MIPNTAPTAEESRPATLSLPPPPAPAGNYASFRLCDGWLFTSGALSWHEGRILHPGQLGAGISIAQGRAAAEAAALNLLALVNDACDGDLDRIALCLQVTCFVACAAGFYDHARVIDPVSDVLCRAFGEARGRHARLAFGAPALPFGSPIEITGIFRLHR